MSRTWLRPWRGRDQQVIAFADRDGAPVTGTLVTWRRERIARAPDGTAVYEREDYRRLRLSRGRARDPKED